MPSKAEIAADYEEAELWENNICCPRSCIAMLKNKFKPAMHITFDQLIKNNPNDFARGSPRRREHLHLITSRYRERSTIPYNVKSATET
jgi:hypothetical protein